MSNNNKDVKFIRVNGKVVPIKAKNDKEAHVKGAKKALDGYEKKRAQKKNKNTSSNSNAKKPKFKSQNTADFFWKAEYMKEGYNAEASTRATIGLVGSGIALQAAGGALMGASTGTAGGAVGALVGAGVSYAGGKLASNNFKAYKRAYDSYNEVNKHQSEAVREEMRRKGHKQGAGEKNWESSFEKTVTSINNSAYRQNRRAKTRRDLYNSYKGY